RPAYSAVWSARRGTFRAKWALVRRRLPVRAGGVANVHSPLTFPSRLSSIGESTMTSSLKHRLPWLALSLTVSALTAMRPAMAQAPKNVASKIERVTVYRGQALVTRRVDLEAAKGPVEAVVPELPENIVPDSLFAEGGEGIEVRAVRFRSRAVGAEPREEV